MSFRKRGEKTGGDTEARSGYKASIIGEILTGEADMEGFVSGPMRRGIEDEPLAAAAYEMVTGIEVDRVGFVIHPTIERAGASPDRLVGADGLLELKCPKQNTHIDYLLNQCLPEEYEPQVMFELACTGRDWCDFVSFQGHMSRAKQMMIKRVYRDEARIAEINAAVLQFLGEVDDIIARLDVLYPESGAPAPLKEKLRQSVEMEDPSLGIQESDLPDWAREMRGTK